MELDFFSLRNRKGLSLAFFLSLFLPLLATAVSSPAQTFTTLASFNGANGYGPNSTLAQGTDGSFYGTTSGTGTLFKITPSGTLTTLSGAVDNPTGLVQATDGNFYGTSVGGGGATYCSGGCGTVFKITQGGMLTTLYSFCMAPVLSPNGILYCPDGNWPKAGLVQSTDGNFYGTTSEGGTYLGGTVFKITPMGVRTTLYSFCAVSAPGPGGTISCADGSDPRAPLFQATDGNFYGTTFNGGINQLGTIFKITPAGTLTTLHSFVGGTPWVYPYAGLVQATDGSFYGTTGGGGSYGQGTVFKITPTGTLTTLHSFCAQTGCPDGGGPQAGLAQGTDGNFYGTTNYGGPGGSGTVFKITPAGALTTLHSFSCAQTPCPDGGGPQAGLVQATDGNFYGTTNYGGPIYTGGTVFSLGVGLAPFVETRPASGAVGAAVIILGNNLTGATGVRFNGTPATFTVVSSSEIETTVPVGASSGIVQVTTPSGTLNSNVSFTVVDVVLDAPSAGSSYYGMYCSTCIAASFTLTASHYVSTIDVVLRTPATTSFTTFDFSLQNSLTAPITTFASEALTAPLGVVSTVVMNVNKTLPAGTYYLVGNVPGYFGTPVTPGDVDGWLLSTGVYNNAAGTVTNGVWASNGSTWTLESGVAPAFSVNGAFQVRFATSGDFDGDGKADYAVWRPSNGAWFVIPSNTPSNFLVQQWGTAGDIPVRGDYDGDGKTDFAVFRPSNGTWFIIPSSNPSAPIIEQWGTQGDIPVPGDYDGDGKTDFAVFRPSTGTWFIIPSSNPSAVIVKQLGTQGDIPVPGDYDGDGKTDFAVWRPLTGTWYIIPTSNPSAPIIRQWGTSGDIPVLGDYDGDGKTDFAVWRPSTGTWFIIPTGNPSAPIVQQWGTVGDIPVPVDYDGDRKTDIAVWRPSNGVWYIIPSSAPSTFTSTQWGTNGDVPVQKPIGQ